MEGVVELDPFGDVVTVEIVGHEVAREDVAVRDQVRARGVERIGKDAGLADESPAVLRVDAVDAVSEVLQGQEVLNIVEAGAHRRSELWLVPIDPVEDAFERVDLVVGMDARIRADTDAVEA